VGRRIASPKENNEMSEVKTLQQRLDEEYESAVKKYKTLRETKSSADFALSHIPEELYEYAVRTYLWSYASGKMEFTIHFPFTKSLIAKTYKIIRKAGWKRKSTTSWDDVWGVNFEFPGTIYVLEVRYDLGNKAATCVKVPKKVKKVMTESEQVLESEIICSEERPDLFEEDEDGNMKYIGEINPEVVVE